MQEHVLGTLDEMRSQESFEIAHTILGVSQQISVQYSIVFCTEMLHLPICSSKPVEVFLVLAMSHQSSVASSKAKKLVPPLYAGDNLRGHLLCHMD